MPRQRPQNVQTQTKQYRKFRGQNNTDSRVAIEDDEFFWIENAVTVGNGAIQITPAAASALVTPGVAPATIWGFTLTKAGTPTAVLIVVHTDGSMSEVNATSGATVAIGGAGTVSTAAHLSIFRDGPILIIDQTTGYKQWSGGGVLTVVDAAKTGVGIASFEGRVWIARSATRTIEFTAPNSSTSFVAGDGAGSTIITDEAFTGVLRAMVSALEQLWILGDSAIEAIANVTSTGTSPNVVTTFSVTNIVTGLGSNVGAANAGYFRALTFQSPVGTYALSGVTPQKLSDKLDGMFPALTLGESPFAIATVQNLLVLCILVTYTQSMAPQLPTPASGSASATKLLLCFTQGKWFVSTQGDLVWITTLIRNGVSEAWGTDGTTIYKLFGGDTDDEVTYKIQSKLYDNGLATDGKQALRFGFEYQATESVEPTITLDNESASQTATVETFGNALTIINGSGVPLTLRNAVNAELLLIAQGLVLVRTRAEMYGRYLGWTVAGDDAPYRIQAFQMQLAGTGEWDTRSN